MNFNKNIKKCALIIFDWLWLSDVAPSQNALLKARTPCFDSLLKKNNYSQLHASWESVGIIKWQIWNSEVWHLTIWSWRITKQSIQEINELFEAKLFKKNNTFIQAMKHQNEYNSSVHILWIIWNSWVHGTSRHLTEIIKDIPENIKIYYHLFTDGRDSSFKNGLDDVKIFTDISKKYKNVAVASVSGRYYAMDRDNNWERIQQCYSVLSSVANTTHLSPCEYIEQSYEKNIFDEFINPVLFTKKWTIKEKDVVFFMNFRSDRARQLSQIIIKNYCSIFFVSMTKYYSEYSWKVFITKNILEDTLPEILSNNRATQLHIAETEKYAHVTKFFSWWVHKIFPGQKDILIPSLKVKTYDLAPKMSAWEIWNTFETHAKNYNFTVVNFANPDMLGHTGSLHATVLSIEYLDSVLSKLVKYSKKHNIELLITSDHGNCEKMWSKKMPHTAHTDNLVPCLYVSQGKSLPLEKKWWLKDIAPTITQIMNITPSMLFTWKSLLKTKIQEHTNESPEN
jgi:2,3-bisphosphoglycerate-independent phosphoglycerate mutase